MYESDSDLTLKFQSDEIPMPVIQCSETSLRQTLIEFLDKIDYSPTNHSQFEDLERAVRNEIVSFGVDLRPGWETILRTSCTLISMAYPKHPIEMQFSIAVCNSSSCI